MNVPDPIPNALDEVLSAYLDGEVSPAERLEIERTLAARPEARERLNELAALRAALVALPRRGAPPDLLQQVTARLERESLLDDGAAFSGARASSRRTAWSMLAAAAVLTFATLLWWRLDQAGSSAPDAKLGMTASRDMLGRAEETTPSSAENGPAESPAPPHDAEWAGEPQSRESAEGRRSGGFYAGDEFARTSPAALPSPVSQRLLDSATFAQKLDAGVGVPDLRRHRFASETSELTINCTSEEERAKVVRSLVGHLRSAGAEDLSRAEDPDFTSAYMAGTLGVNYSTPDERQFLAHLSGEEWSVVLRAVREEVGDASSEFRSGLVVATGWSAAEALLEGSEGEVSMGLMAMRQDRAGAGGGAHESASATPSSQFDARQISPDAAVRDLVDVLLARQDEGNSASPAESQAETPDAQVTSRYAFALKDKSAEPAQGAPPDPRPEAKKTDDEMGRPALRVKLDEQAAKMPAEPRPPDPSPPDDSTEDRGNVNRKEAPPAPSRAGKAEKQGKERVRAEDDRVATQAPPAAGAAPAEAGQSVAPTTLPTRGGAGRTPETPAAEGTAAERDASLKALGYVDAEPETVHRSTSLVERRRAASKKPSPPESDSAEEADALRETADRARSETDQSAGEPSGATAGVEIQVLQLGETLGKPVQAQVDAEPSDPTIGSIRTAVEPGKRTTVLIRIRVVPPAVK